MKTDGHKLPIDAASPLVNFEFFIGGMMLVIYFGSPIAMIDEHGEILMRNINYPIFLIEYLIQNYEMHKFQWN